MTARRPRQRETLPEAGHLFGVGSRLEHEYVDGKCCMDDRDRQLMLEIVNDIIEDRDPRDRFFKSVRGRRWLDTEAKKNAALAIGMMITPGHPPTDEFFDYIAHRFKLSDDQVRHIYRRVRKNRFDPDMPQKLVKALSRLQNQGDK